MTTSRPPRAMRAVARVGAAVAAALERAVDQAVVAAHAAAVRADPAGRPAAGVAAFPADRAAAGPVGSAVAPAGLVAAPGPVVDFRVAVAAGSPVGSEWQADSAAVLDLVEHVAVSTEWSALRDNEAAQEVAMPAA